VIIVIIVTAFTVNFLDSTVTFYFTYDNIKLF